jgi:hypothetical protein
MTHELILSSGGMIFRGKTEGLGQKIFSLTSAQTWIYAIRSIHNGIASM